MTPPVTAGRGACAAMFLSSMFMASIAGAQTPADAPPQPVVHASKWELEGHAGLSIDGDHTAGVTAIPVTGTITQGLIALSTFYFGDGARLFNQNQPAIGAGDSLITPLDPILGASAIKHEGGLTVGARIQRRLNRRLALEASGDYTRGKWSFRPEALAGIEAARASFTSALQRTLATTALPSAVSSVATVSDNQSASRLLATGALVINLSNSERTVPYAVAGAGLIANDGTTPAAVLTGDYSLGNPAVLLGTDAVTLRYVEDDTAIVYLGGGGIKRMFSRRAGIRVDGRVHVFKSSLINVVDVAPVRATMSNGGPPPVINLGALQFSSTSPLNGPSLTGASSFTSSGLQHTVSITAGFFVRF